MAVKTQIRKKIGSDARPRYTKLEATLDRARPEGILPGERSEDDIQTPGKMTAGGRNIGTTPNSQINGVNGEEVTLPRNHRAGLVAHAVNRDTDPHLPRWMNWATQEQWVVLIGPLTQDLSSR